MVPVSHDHNFIFLKAHKTASTSTEMFFEPFCAPPEHEVSISTPARETKHGIIGRRNDADGEVRSGKGIRPPKKFGNKLVGTPETNVQKFRRAECQPDRLASAP